ncbi:MAG: anaerobic sulfatase maturase [Eubacteriales bacterium]|nr:anaerobic sulfatase maturase [Eubacteriales bacterium]
MPPLSLLIKPASSLCNLRCRYCFYHDLSSNRSVASYGLMSDAVLNQVLDRAFEQTSDALSLAFQGGEPTLCGLDFYRKLVAEVDRRNTRRIPVQYAIQTNGQVIDADWARFLAEHRFLVGLSIDGPAAMHDALRVDAQGNGSHKRAMQAAAHFKAQGTEFNVLAVVSDLLARHPDKVYRFFSQQGFQYLQFIPCLAPLGTDPKDDPHAVRPERFGAFLIRVFDLWFADLASGKPVSIRLFDNYVRMLAGEAPEQCGLSGVCTCQMVIEADGGVYPCDFYVNDTWRLGDVFANSFADLLQSEKAQSFVAQSRPVPDHCQACRWYPLCRNGCRRDRLDSDTNAPGINRLCAAYESFFAHAYTRLEWLAGRLQTMQRQGNPR